MKSTIKEIERIEKKLSGRGGTLRVFLKKTFFIFFFFIATVFYRIFEIFVSLIFGLFLTVPLFFILILRRILFRKSVFINRMIFGRNSEKLEILLYNIDKNYLQNLPLFFYIIFGKFQLVGPSSKSFDSDMRLPGDNYIQNEKPGIFNLFFIRKSSRIDFEGQFKTDWEYVFKKNFLYDILLILKTVPAFFYSQTVTVYKSKINLLEVDFMNITMNEAIDHIDDKIMNKERSSFYFVNPDCFNKIFSDSEYLSVLQKGSFVFPDGIGVTIACKILKTPLKQNINGTDMFPFICRSAVKKKHSLYLLGAKPGVVDKMKKNIEKTFPGIIISGCRDGYFDRDAENQEVIDEINRLDTKILLVAFGAPGQEKWIHDNFYKLKPSILMGVGGLFDFYSGNTKRAPVWMREIGLEWFYRILQEPKRMWKRYVIGNPLFLFRVLKWKNGKL